MTTPPHTWQVFKTHFSCNFFFRTETFLASCKCGQGCSASSPICLPNMGSPKTGNVLNNDHTKLSPQRLNIAEKVQIVQSIKCKIEFQRVRIIPSPPLPPCTPPPPSREHPSGTSQQPHIAQTGRQSPQARATQTGRGAQSQVPEHILH